MPLYDQPPPMTMTSYNVAYTRDSGGGETPVYTVAQANIPCSINQLSASETTMFAQQQMTVSDTVAILASVLTTPITRGMRLVADDTGQTFLVQGIKAGRAYNGIPALNYYYCEEIL